MDLNTRKILSLFASILFTIPVYIILHEGGHALIALSCGARITEFSILGAYMRYGGGTFTALTLSLFYIAGMLLPVLISIAYMLLYRDAAQSVFYRIFSSQKSTYFCKKDKKVSDTGREGGGEDRVSR